MDSYGTRRNQSRRARERQMARQHRSASTAPLKDALRGQLSGMAMPNLEAGWIMRVRMVLQDLFWYITHTQQIVFGIIGLIAVVFLLFIGSHLVTGRVFPNVWSLNVPLGDLTTEEVVAALQNAWSNQYQIKLVDGERQWTVKPADLGLQLDAQKTAEAARGVGLSGLPFGISVKPAVTVDYNTANNYLLNLTTATDIAPFNAGYEWKNDQLIGIAGQNGRMLDTSLTMDTLQKKTVDIAQLGQLDLTMSVIPPLEIDPEPYIQAATRFVTQNFTLNGYDPFTDQTTTWTTTKESLASWLEVGEQGLTLRDANYAPFLNAQIQSLNPPQATETRYLDPRETQEKMNKAIGEQSASVMLRIRYRDTRYTVEAGDRAYYISRKTGIPFYLIQEANPGRNLDVLSPGDILNLPSKDKSVPLDPVPSKRIVVDLDTQSMIAFENGQEKFKWLISSGMDQYPTSPGIYQILTHSEEAAGGSFTLCSDSGLNCGSWTMYWFMGMYEVVPGLMNGFHGAVLLPNGNLLGGGSVGSQYTFGCVMAQNDNAKALYDWADQGTVVEIISGEYKPQSELGQKILTASISNGT